MFTLAGLVLAFTVLDGPWRFVAIAAGAVADLAQNVLYVRWSQRRRAAVGVQTLVGRRAVVTAACRPDGQVRIAGELWRARCPEGAAEGEEVEVVSVDGLTLEVARRSERRL